MTYDVQTPGVARLWPYQPDWNRGVPVTRGFKTDIATSRDGTEQRRALRKVPRRSVQYQTVVSGSERRAADLFLRTWQNKPVVAPDFTRYARLAALSAATSNTLTLSPVPAWAAAGQTLVLCADGGVLEQVLVDSVVGTTVTLADPLVNSWASGSVVRPTFFGLFDGEMRTSRLNRDAAQVSVSISAYPGGEPPRSAGTAWATFNGREVFTLQPDYAGAPSFTYAWPVEQIDFEIGRTAEFRPIERMLRRLECDFNGQDATAAGEIEQFFDRMVGRREAFYMPTWEQDLLLQATAGSGTSTITFLGDQTEPDAFDAIAVCLTNGTQLYRSLSSPTLISGNTRFNVNAAWPTSLTAANVARISWMPLWRFASDEMTTVWRTTLSANVRLGYQQVAG